MPYRNRSRPQLGFCPKRGSDGLMRSRIFCRIPDHQHEGSRKGMGSIRDSDDMEKFTKRFKFDFDLPSLLVGSLAVTGALAATVLAATDSAASGTSAGRGPAGTLPTFPELNSLAGRATLLVKD
ncbi:hypothetical protein PsorP6_010488 [Peronosclerospora sorghi]|uniref:Uncharacterized protein n=1 Tax=Peronosclerospora sorghi TaxID=230839 RepID=A0ACC0VTX4_9STRA|nr:hypothetical protein PsorP6_010488 [Peronosclerospora sorghi]